MQERLLSQVHRRYRVDVICVTKGDLFSLQGSSPEAAYPNPTYGIKERIWTLMHKNPSSRKRYSHCLGGRVILQNMCGKEHSQSWPFPPRDIWFKKVLSIKIPFPVRECLFPQEEFWSISLGKRHSLRIPLPPREYRFPYNICIKIEYFFPQEVRMPLPGRGIIMH